MRPVDKKNAGDTILLADNKTQHPIQTTYNPYQTAKPALIANLGHYCSYCEVAIIRERDLEVEHVQPKSKQSGMEYSWDNFLLGCSTCNERDNKGTKSIDPLQCHFPDKNNTFKSFIYKTGGVIEINPYLTGISYDNAEALYKLVGFDKTPITSSPSDNRWKTRMEDWSLAIRYQKKYKDGKCDTETIIDLIAARGGWSIWFTVFKGYDEIRKAMIEKFPGTSASCFDALNHYEPLDRNPGQSDPV